MLQRHRVIASSERSAAISLHRGDYFVISFLPPHKEADRRNDGQSWRETNLMSPIV